MTVIHSGVFSVLKDFPDQKEIIKHLFMEKEQFLILCEDYRVCKEALVHWRLSGSERAPALCREYLALLQELEAEILQNVNEFKS